MAKPLTTAAAVIDALGGPAATARLTGQKSQHVWNWKNSDRFPSKTFLVLTAALREKGDSASPELWGMAPINSKAVGE